MRGFWAGLPLLFLLASARWASAETHRVAVVVGNNAGTGDRPPLHYAEADADKIARVLVELGGVAPSDLLLLQGRDLGALREALKLAGQKVTLWRTSPADRVVLIFYFSGHSDGEALELGRERLAFAELRRWLSSTGAEVRLGIVDSCKSGALLATKGGREGPGFQVRLTDDLVSTGEALLTSSASDEVALESREIHGSFFTHHLVSGLRGAADSSGDGLVTLSEAYQYAFTHTVSATANTVIGPQHPAYDYRLSGQGELVLAELSRPTAALELPSGFDRILLVQPLGDRVIAELASGAARKVAVSAGDYAVRAWRGSRIFAARVAVATGERRVVRAAELVPVASAALSVKGEAVAAPEPPTLRSSPSQPATGPAVVAAFGAQQGVAESLGPLVGLRLGIRGRRPSGFSLALDVATGSGAGFRETSALLFGGYRLGLERGPFSVFAGLELGGGAVVQNFGGGPSQSSGMVAGAPWIGAAAVLSRRISVGLEGHLPVGLLRLDRELSAVVLPAVWLGLAVAL